MSIIPSPTLIHMVMQERELEARKAAWARAARLARQCCEASAGLATRLLEAVGLRRRAACEG
jgi:hypothetical protein